MLEHTERLTITDALAWDCAEGECEHIDDDGQPEDWSACPKLTIEVCVDCMDEREFGRDPRFWEELVSHTDPPMPDPVPEPPIFKPSPDVEIRTHENLPVPCSEECGWCGENMPADVETGGQP